MIWTFQHAPCERETADSDCSHQSYQDQSGKEINGVIKCCWIFTAWKLVFTKCGKQAIGSTYTTPETYNMYNNVQI